MAEEIEQNVPVAAPPVVAEAETPPATPEPDAGSAGEAEGEKVVKRKLAKGAKNIAIGLAHVNASFNNTMVSFSDLRGNVISWANAGRCGFKGSRKSTAFAATTVAQEAARVATGHGLREVEVLVQGPGSGRESAVRAIQAAGINVTAIKDVTPIPHNGCRPRKRRRV
ncbi:MAG: 30S ribosomal protein S11 [Candidatus Marinimicrobia bacterium]|nr:30S ribosomal protein S11 [Candidatus Neomarinimicrobiota bacterium]